MSLSRIMQFLKPPVFEDDEDKTSSAQLVYTLLLAVLLCDALFVATLIAIQEPITGFILTFVAALGLVALGLLVMLRLGYLKHVAWVLSATLWLGFTTLLFGYGGLHDSALMGFFVVILVAGLSNGARTLLVFVLLSATSIAGVYIAEHTQLIHPFVIIPSPPYDFAFVFIVLIASGWALNFAVRRLDNLYTQARRNAGALSASERRFRALVENIGEIIILLDDQGRERYASPGALRTLGYEVGEFETRSVFEIIHDDDLPRVTEGLFRLLNEPGRQTTGILRAIHKDGSLRWAEAAASNQLHNPDVQGIVVNFRDITDRRQMEAQLLASQKMASLGTLAAGIAHEINSPLQVITGLSDRHLADLRKASLDESRLEGDIEKINRNAWRIANIVRSMLTFAHSSVEQVESHDLNKVIQDTLLLIEHKLNGCVSFELSISGH